MGKAKKKISSTKFIQDLHENEEFKKIRKQYHEFKEDMAEVKEKVRDQVDTTENKAVSTT